MAKPLTIDMPQLWQALREVEATWTIGRWPGLPTVIAGCMQSLGYKRSWLTKQRDDLGRFARVLTDLASDVERIGCGMKQLGCEPAYHSRKHMAQVALSMTALLLARRPSNTLAPTDVCHEMLLLSAALGHDVLHDGRRNDEPRQSERVSAQHVAAMYKRHGLSAYWRGRLVTIIEMTDPLDTANNHSVLHNATSLDSLTLCCVLMNEADILASTLPDIGIGLTEELATEWDLRYPQDAKGLRTESGRSFFLQHMALFSSESAKRLGLPAIRQQQLDTIEAA